MHMTDRNIRRWALLGALVSAALLTPACDWKIPKEGTDHEGVVNEAQKVPGPSASQPEAQPDQQRGIGGSGSQQQQAAQPQQGLQRPIGAPGYSSPNDSPLISPLPVEPQPQLRESSGNSRTDERLHMIPKSRSHPRE